MSRKRIVAVVAIAVVLLGAALAANAAAARVRGMLAFTSASIDLHHAAFTGLRVTVNGKDPVFEADRLEIDYDLRGLTLAARRAFGFVGLEAIRPRVTLVHYKDGSWNVPLGKGGPAHANPAIAPYIFDVRVRDGSIAIRDETRLYPQSQTVNVDGIDVDASIDQNARSTYAVAAALVDSGHAYPIHGHGTLDDPAGFELNRWTAAALPVGPLIDYALNSPSLNMADGYLRDVDARYFGLPDTHGTIVRHLAANGVLDGARVYLGSLTAPIRDLHGRVEAYDDGMTTPRMDGDLAGIPLVAAGGVYHLTAPQLRMAANGRGTLAQLGSVSPMLGRAGVSGDLAFSLFVEGDAKQPLIFGSVKSTKIRYHDIPVRDVAALVALNGTEADLLSARARYGPFAISGRGRTLLNTKRPYAQGVARVSVPSSALPYAAAIAPGLDLTALVAAEGHADRFTAGGIVEGANPEARLDGTFSFFPNGNGTIGPLALDRRDGSSLYVRVSVDRTHGDDVAFVAAHDLHVDTARNPTLPGMRLGALPRLSATIGGDVVAQVHGSHLVAAQVANAQAAGPWGRLTGDGGYTNGAVALQGRLTASLDALSGILGHGVVAHGRIDAPLAVVSDGRRTVAQIRDARFAGATIRGVPIASLSGTFGMRGSSAYDIYGARIGVAHGDVVASGSFGNGGTLHVAASGLDPGSFAGRTPLSGGRLGMVGAVGGTLKAPRAQAGIVLSDARYRRTPVDAGTALDYANGRLDVDGATLAYGTMLATLDGSVAGIDPRGPFAPRYALQAHLRGAEIAALAASAGRKLPPTDGQIDADMRVFGAGSSPGVAGRIEIPIGSVNGLTFEDASVAVGDNVRALTARDGRVVIGTTTIGFDGSYAGGTAALAVRAPHADLADFNDYFDQADTLGGTGSLAASVRVGRTIGSNGAVALQHLRLRRIELGTTNARWTTTGSTVRTNVAVRGASGAFGLAGSVGLPTSDPMRDTIRRSDLDLTASAQHLDLREYLPLVGLQAPVIGYIDAAGSVRGRYPALAANAHAALSNGAFGRIPIEELDATASVHGSRAQIDAARLRVAHLTIDANGSAGLQPRAPLALTAKIASDDVGALYDEALGQTLALSGTLASTLTIGGTPASPTLRDTLAVDDIRYHDFAIPHVGADVVADRHTATLSNGVVQFTRGRIVASGTVPVGPAPAAPRGRPVAVAALGVPAGAIPPARGLQIGVQAQGIELGQFASLLEKGTHLAGTLDGRLGVGGTMDAPALNGGLTLAGGAFSSPSFTSGLTAMTGDVTLAGNELRLVSFDAKAGAGTLAASGSAHVPELRDPLHDTTFRFQADATNAGVDAPQYFRGVLNGNVYAQRTAARDPIHVGGEIAISNARIPTTAFYNPKAPKGAKPPPLPIAFDDFKVSAGRDVRVQNSFVDIGVSGALTVGGTIASPTLAGAFNSTGGTIDVYRDFRIQRGRVAFTPADGLMPAVDAVATTTLSNPPIDIRMTITGIVPNLNLGLTSDPAYPRAQILGLLLGVQALGAIPGVTSGTASVTPASLAESEATGILQTQLTRTLFEPLQEGIGQALGLSNLQLYLNSNGGFEAHASKGIAKNVQAIFGETVGNPARQIVGLRATPSKDFAIEATVFQQEGALGFGATQSYLQSLAYPINQTLNAITPDEGTSGWSFSLQRTYP